MTLRALFIGTLTALALTAAPREGFAQFKTPHTTAVAGDETTTLGTTVVVNHGLVGVGRISASVPDTFGETFGSVSSLQVTNWTNLGNGSYGGTFNILPDRGYNSGNFYADYAARIQQVSFVFTPYTGSTGVGGTSLAEKIAAQNQILFTSGISGVKFTYLDPTRGALSVTTGLDPAGGTATIFGKVMPYVTSYTGLQSPSSASNTTYTGINKLPLDSEALVIKADGSGYIGDEYGANIYYFNASKQIVGAIVPPAAIVPHAPAGTVNFGSASAPTNGRRNNQGMEGVSLSPDGTTLFALLQSATIQDSDSNNDQTRLHTRLLVYDVSSNATPAAPVAEYVLTLPTYKANGNNGAVNKTAAQSEIIALDNSRLLVLSRDGNGLGNASENPSVYKSILLVDTRVGNPTNVAGTAADAEGGKVTSAPGVLAPGITTLSRVEALNMLNSTQLNKFNIQLDTAPTQVSQLTLGEKWEGMSLVPANDPSHPDDYFLFVANDNDFLTSSGLMRGPDGTIVSYDGFASGYPASRLPVNAGGGNINANDTMFLAYRLTIAAAPTVTRGGFVYDRRTRQFAQQLTVTNTGATALGGAIYVAIDGLSANAALANKTGTTANSTPAGSPYITVVAAGGTLAPGASAGVVLQFDDPTLAAITYTPRVLALSSGTP
jgi:hypothetical protein